MRVLLVDHDSEALETISRAIRGVLELDCVTSKGDALLLLRQNTYDVLIACERCVDGSGLDLLGRTTRTTVTGRALRPVVAVLVVGALGSAALAWAAWLAHQRNEDRLLEQRTRELEEAVAKKKKIMGLGHRVYKVKDPRATVLQELAEHVFAETSRPRNYDVAVEVEKAAAAILGPKGIYPNVDFYSGIVYSSLGIDRDLFTPIFVVARVAGWLAHWLEQLKNNRIFRPEQVYVGKRDQQYVPLDQRP